MNGELGIQSVLDAYERIRGDVVRTPLLSSPLLNSVCHAEILIKPETLQHTGSFKIRGALSFMRLMTDEQRKRGVVSTSSGNHGYAVAEAARQLSIDATILMPDSAPQIKRDNVLRTGAKLMFCGPDDDRIALARALADEGGAVYVPAVDHHAVIAGQGTVTLEALRQAEDIWHEKPDIEILPVGGGGLAAGAATVLAAQSRQTRLIGVEPEGHDDTRRSLDSGRVITNAPGIRSMCDALLSGSPGQLSFPVSRAYGMSIVSVTDDDVARAMMFALRELKLVTEPSGAVGLAALLSGGISSQGRRILLILSGGNTDFITMPSHPTPAA
ncbi:serine dehydratase [Pandoraea iniqua]|uniref:Serine dehydratase n=1 Tax=Pandoraea iniqua TaxID=2508288 RepID=A0A5E4VT63_9BURK|nr:threonine/serine dehydratase [Pandoraea iniqua]VVE15582.1 serine dehydratase [Pandoraea iniqua]